MRADGYRGTVPGKRGLEGGGGEEGFRRSRAMLPEAEVDVKYNIWAAMLAEGLRSKRRSCVSNARLVQAFVAWIERKALPPIHPGTGHPQHILVSKHRAPSAAVVSSGCVASSRNFSERSGHPPIVHFAKLN